MWQGMSDISMTSLVSTLMSWNLSLHEHIQDRDACLLHLVLISLLFFSDDLILLASSPVGKQRWIVALANFCDLRQLIVNLGRTKVMVFNALKCAFSNSDFYFQGEEIEIMTTYTFGGPICGASF
jgi:hypothetical protein